MYQTIDDPDEDGGREGSFSVWPFLIGALLAAFVFFLVWLFSPGSPAQPGQAVETPATRAAYLAAISEQTPALRRARLIDYQRAFPDTDRKDAVIDQLDIIQQAELADWNSLIDRIYDGKATTADKRQALIDYETKWNRALLGGRGEEVDALAEEIIEKSNAEALPSRVMEDLLSPIPLTLPSDTLAGAPPSYQQPVFLPPVTLSEGQRPKANDVVVQPRVRRNVTPRYPRSARRRNVGAVVVVAMNINEKGRVEMTEIVSVEADRYGSDFVKAAERAAMRTRFNPKTINGEAVPAVGVRKRYIFRAEN